MKHILLTALLFASGAWAEDRQIEYSEKILPFTEWSTKFPQERNVLGLFKNYVEPTVNFNENGINKSAVANLTMYTTRIRTSISKPAANIDLPALIKPESLAQLDKAITPKLISAAEIMPKVAGNGPINNFKWCQKNNDGKTYISLPNYEQNLSYLNGERAWCPSDGRTTCVELCYLFTNEWQQGILAYNLAKKVSTSNPAEQKDYGIAMQAEARFFTSEGEYGQNVRELTQINSPVCGIVEINIFYVNQVMQYAKVVAVFQEHPSNAQATVVTTLSAIGIRSKTWNKHTIVQDVLKGKSKFNTSESITAGVPKFTQNIAKNLASMLEK